MLRFLTAGESHGKAEVAILEGLPAGLSITKEEVDLELQKRANDFGRGGRGKIEKDQVEILSGVRFGKTLGSPVALLINNADYANWQGKVSPKITSPRPGHADLAGVLKYGFDDVRNVLERASARETVMRVATGAVCKKLLLQIGIKIASHTIQIGKIKIGKSNYSFEDIVTIFDKDPEFRCIDEKIRKKMRKEILNARMNKDTLGGVIEIIAHNVPVGLGSYVHFDRKLDGKIAEALMSIPSVKAVEIGNCLETAEKTGKEVQDAIYYKNNKLYRKTNNMGGVEGGVTNGEDIICRVFHKPISTIYDPLPTVDIKTLKPTVATIQRSDVCVVARAGVISEAMLAYVLANAVLEKFGGDSISELRRNFQNYKKNLPL